MDAPRPSGTAVLASRIRNRLSSGRASDDEVVAYVKAVGTLGSGARKVLDGANAEKLIPNLNERLTVQLNAGKGVLPCPSGRPG